jgi:HPt (histidine-containing phosphotransfer) domain-containing protein
MGQDATGGAVDFAYLEGFAAGDMHVVQEVLSLFRQQAELWSATLDPAEEGWRDVVHTIKGAARGVGANALGDVCARAEAAGPGDLPKVKAALDATVAEIAAYQATSKA